MKNDNRIRRHLGLPMKGEFLVWVPAILWASAIVITIVLIIL